MDHFFPRAFTWRCLYCHHLFWLIYLLSNKSHTLLISHQSWTVVPLPGHVSYLCCLSCSLSGIKPLLSLTNVSSSFKRHNSSDLFCLQSAEEFHSQFCNRKAHLDHMFPVAYARVSSKSTKAADSDTGDTDVKKVLQENYSCKSRKWYKWGL